MSDIAIGDDFYPGISIYRNLRQSPDAIVNHYGELLDDKGFTQNKSNLILMLKASRELYQYIGGHAREELSEYESETSKDQRPVRGAAVLQFDLVYAILVQIVEYVRNHPKDSLEAAAAFAVLEDFIEEKMGKVAGRIWRKISTEASNTGVRKRIARLFRLRRAKRKSARGRKPKPRKRQKRVKA